jgi:hypothetical protein
MLPSYYYQKKQAGARRQSQAGPAEERGLGCPYLLLEVLFIERLQQAFATHLGLQQT